MILSNIIQTKDGIVKRDGTFDTFDYCTTDFTHQFLGFLENEDYLSKISPYMSCVICKKVYVKQIESQIKGICVSEEPKLLWKKSYNAYAKREKQIQTYSDTVIGEGTKIHSTAVIANKQVQIGKNVTIEEFVVIKENVTIGDDCVIRTGCILGGKGFQHTRAMSGDIIDMEDMGQTILEREVELYPYVQIANATMPYEITRIGEATKIDSFSQIHHGVQIGKRTLIASGVQIGGNCRIGDDVWIGINATISNRIHVGDLARISLGSVVTKNVAANCTVTGNFAIDHSIFLHNLKRTVNENNSYSLMS